VPRFLQQRNASAIKTPPAMLAGKNQRVSGTSITLRITLTATLLACHFEEPKAWRYLALPRKQIRARFLAEFTLSGRARFFAPLRMTSEGLRRKSSF